jgi:hypothetical protein
MYTTPAVDEAWWRVAAQLETRTVDSLACHDISHSAVSHFTSRCGLRLTYATFALGLGWSGPFPVYNPVEDANLSPPSP